MTTALARKKPLRKSGSKDSDVAGMSDAAVKNATGRTWPQWFALMDKAGCATLTHKEIVAFLEAKHRVGPWWQQMVTVGYEQARGLRDKHQKPSGYEISVSKTLNASTAGAFLWWTMEKCRRQWLDGVDVVIHKKSPSKSLRATWNADTTKPQKSISVNFHSTGRGKTQMTIQHGKLASVAEAKKMKAFWAARLKKLEELLEG